MAQNLLIYYAIGIMISGLMVPLMVKELWGNLDSVFRFPSQFDATMMCLVAFVTAMFWPVAVGFILGYGILRRRK